MLYILINHADIQDHAMEVKGRARWSQMEPDIALKDDENLQL